ncbi:MAG: ABC transporter substrate-binding protein [Burkholderiales bacterium]|nr:ABC transporter substrate-binding protein [Burkholderiales bacterium]
MLNRRRFIQVLASGASAPALPALSQSTGRVYRVGWLAGSSEMLKEPQALAFEQRLRELGFVEGRNLAIERRHISGRLEELPAAAAELAKLNCDALFCSGAEAYLTALTKASRNTPIVVVAVDFDPVATGYVASLARPGGRVTGITAIQSELPAKRLEILGELLPRMTRVAALNNEQTAAQLEVVQSAAKRLGLTVHVADLKRPPFDYAAAFAGIVRAKAEALIVLGSGLWVPARPQIIRHALDARLPTMFHQAQWVESGGLMSYGFNFPSMWRRGAEMLVNILRGAAPATTPMEQPTTFEMVINAKLVKALGIKVPPTILARADRVVE